ncbi:putative LPS assembly protein LptD [Filimonas lacunae]|nr:putative LPS assembly protein LptD [Filimonas lacunae]
MTFDASAQNKRKLPSGRVKNTTGIVSDTVPKPGADTTHALIDSAGYRRDSTGRMVKIDTIGMSKDSLDVPIDYTAEDSAIVIIPTRQFYLYGKASVNYNKDKLEANTIHYNQADQTLSAYGGKDTSKNPLNLPTFTQGDTKAIMDSIHYNIKTGKGLTKNSYYQEGEMFVNAQILKKMDKDVSYAYKARFTTCNLDTPHFAFRTKRVKIINDKFAVTGPAYPEFEGVPMPVAIPFGIFPLARGRHSGLLPPQFTSNESYGLGLEGLGYYKVLSDNWDLLTRANIYTYGGWALYLTSKYNKRYKYTGNLNLSILKTKILNTSTNTQQEFTQNTSFLINWSHSSDTRARPGTTFSASVNAGSTKYNSYVPNNTITNFTNQLSSSITYSKTWSEGKYNLTASANHSQNNNLGLVSVTLPTLAFTATTFYPFQKKESVGSAKWYEKLGISYSGSFLNQVAFYDSAFSFRKLIDTAQWGANHSIPISITLPAVGPLLFTPSISYNEKWYGNYLQRRYDDVKDTVYADIVRGFYTAREVSFGLSTNTRIFGTFSLGKDTKLRHEIKPTFSINYKPDLVSKYYDTLRVPATNKHAAYNTTYSKFDGSVVGGFSQGRFGGFNFGFDNLFEMKKRNKQDSTGDNPYKKIKLIDGLSFNTGYNFFADTLKWSAVSMAFRSTLFEKINITGSASLDPYAVDSFGNRVNKLLWKQGSLGRFTGGSLSVSSSFQSKKTDNRSDAQRTPTDNTMTPDEQQRQLEYVRANPAEFTDFNIPWTLQTSLSLNFSRIRRADYSGYYTQINSSLNLNGDFSLTPKWKLGGTIYYDIKNTQIQTMTMFVSREMHCWQMSINITPVGIYKSFNITLNPKSGILRDLKVNRTRSYYTP